jgi:signal transduction histidine kinase
VRIKRGVDDMRIKDQAMIQQNGRAALGEMINNIAHQWRQPLNVISLIVQSVKLRFESGMLTSEEMNSDIQDVMENIMHMSQTVEDFRNFFKQDKVKQEFFISEAVNRAMSLVSASLEDHNIKVEIKIDDDATIIGYQNEYSQVLLNLFSNTCDACIERTTSNCRIYIRIARENELSVLYFRDNCGGIPDDVISKIFEPYFTTRGSDKGTGIGLYMSKMIIEQNMGGHLTARNVIGGAEFRIEV